MAEINKKKLPTISITKPMSTNVCKREYNTIKKAIEDRQKFNDKQHDKRWALAKKKALNLKRSELRKEAKEKADAEKKRLLEAAKAKAAEQKKAKAEAAKKAQAESQASTSAGAADNDDVPEAEDSAESEDEVYTPSKSKSRAGPAPTTSPLPTPPPRARRPLLPDTGIESRFGVILDEMKKLNTTMSGLKLDFERQERVSLLLQTYADWIIAAADVSCRAFGRALTTISFAPSRTTTNT